MGMQHVAALYENDRRREVRIETWGHLAPEKNVKYPVSFVAAVPYFDSLNPVILSVVPEDGPWSGPWFYGSISEYVSEKLGEDEKAGCLYRFVGHWRNYRFVGRFHKVRLMDKNRRRKP